MVQTHLDDTPPEDLDLEELRAQYNDLNHELFEAFYETDEAMDAAYDRKLELWNELESRIDTEYPACPECGATDWSQTIGDPKYCATCGLELSERHAELIQAIDQEWNKIFGSESGGDST